MGYAPQGYGQQRQNYGGRGGFSRQQQPAGPTVIVKGMVDFCEEVTTQNGNTYYKVGINQVEYSCWKPEIAEEIYQAQATQSDIALLAQQKGRYWNILGLADASSEATPQAPMPAVAAPMQRPVRPQQQGYQRNGGDDRNEYWIKKFELDVQAREDIMLSVALKSAIEVTNNMKLSGIPILDKYVEKGILPREAYLMCVEENMEECVRILKNEPQPEPKIPVGVPKHVVETLRKPVSRGQGIVEEEFQSGDQLG